MSQDESGKSRLSQVSRNVTVNGRRTSIRMEPIMWDSLDEIAAREKKSMNVIVEMIDSRRQGASLTASLRVFIISYFKTAAELGKCRPMGFSEDADFGSRSSRIQRALDACGPVRRR